MAGFNIVHDVLDAQLIDRQGERIGRVDELVLELRDDGPPRIAAILVGSPMRAARIARWWAAAAAVLRRAIGLGRAEVTRIPFTHVRCIGKHIDLEVAGIDTPALRGERRLRALLQHIPGARRKEQSPQ